MTHEMIRYYAERAPEYDRLYELPGWQDDLRTLRALVTAVCAARRVFEVACGTGYQNFYEPARLTGLVEGHGRDVTYLALRQLWVLRYRVR